MVSSHRRLIEIRTFLTLVYKDGAMSSAGLENAKTPYSVFLCGGVLKIISEYLYIKVKL